jgi:hypothetical protein
MNQLQALKQEFINFYQTHPEWALGGVFALMMVLVLMYVWIRHLSRTKHARGARRQIKHAAVDMIKDVILPDGVNDNVFISYLALSNKGILVVNVQNYPGILFGGEKIDLWTQVYNHKSYKFDNPIRYHDMCVQAVKLLAPEVPVIGRVLFTDAGDFPKGIPDGVSLTRTFAEDISTISVVETIPEEWQSAWFNLKQSTLEPMKKGDLVTAR